MKLKSVPIVPAFLLSLNLSAQPSRMSVFNVRNMGATGIKSDNAQKAIHSAIDACSKTGLPETEVYLYAGDKVIHVTFLNNDLRLARPQ